MNTQKPKKKKSVIIKTSSQNTEINLKVFTWDTFERESEYKTSHVGVPEKFDFPFLKLNPKNIVDSSSPVSYNINSATN